MMSNWYVIVGILAICIFIVYNVYRWFHLPTKEQIANIKEWLKYGVTQAEFELGKGTGQLKLRMVYDMALSKFKWLSFISFDLFSAWVDEALEWLNVQLTDNKNLKEYVEM